MSSGSIQTAVEARLAERRPDVEVLLAEVLGGHTLRVFIDHPDGVTTQLCADVSADLIEFREEYALEVSSPGTERPLSRPEHFRRFLGRRARVRTREPREGRRTFTGRLLGASEEEVTLAAEDGVVSIPFAAVSRSNLVGE